MGDAITLTGDKVQVTVPLGAAGRCAVEVDSDAVGTVVLAAAGDVG